MAATTIEAIARWAADLRFSDLPERIVEKARWQQASVLGASFAGLHDPGARKVLAATAKHGGSGPARVIAGGFSSSRPAAVFANASVSCTFDFDEILLLGHTGHSAVTVPLVLGEELGRPWSDAVLAQVAANEVAARLGLATFLGPQNGQMLPYIHAAGAAIAAGKLLGLSAEPMAHALAVSLAQAPAPLWPAFLGPIESKVLIAAQGAAMGVRAAELAAEGFSGTLDLLDHPRGFFHRFTFVPFPRALTGFGRTWLSDTLQVKLNASCWYWQALLDELREQVAALGRPIRLDEVRRGTCRVTFLAHSVDAMERLIARPSGGALTANDVNFSIPIGVAMMLERGRLVPDDLGPAELAARGDRVRAAASRIAVLHDRGLTRRLLGTLDAAIDVAGLAGSASLPALVLGLRRAKDEFPAAGALSPVEILRTIAEAPSALAALVEGRRRPYDLGAHDLSSFSLPIPGGFEIELAGGVRLTGERDVEAGALSLPGASERARAKLEDASRTWLGAEAAALLGRSVAEARPDTPVAQVLSAIDLGARALRSAS
jgi:2-methylcitrate dehydratase PrpD